ncbi:O-antigen/teichoic acid export membrane protein [Pedobacter sp. CAN_A7]|uniref:lipopolysaccharide biosynthesis protein n=1 Tax=Pedobacter sp. CAN_A7 TaxID=2787722 RepID=UPI0018C91748
MSVTSRLISGSVASWIHIGITLVTQIALVPLYLTYWNIETYGLWLAVLSLGTLLTALDFGYQEYLGFEFLKIGKDNRLMMSKYLSSGSLIGFTLAIFQIVVVIILLSFGTLPSPFETGMALLGKNEIYQAGIILLIQSITWLLTGSISGIINRALSTYGYYPRMAWWGVFVSVTTNLTPAIMVIQGYSLLETGVMVGVVKVLIEIPIYYDRFRLLHRERIRYVKPSLKIGWATFLQSFFLSITGLLENMRQQGARLLITPFTGAAGLAAFSTMRTGTNVAMQGLHTITNPLMPDFMRFLHDRDQARCEIAFGTIWMITVSLLAPAFVCLQVFIGPLFVTWTRGNIPFNPWLFAILSLCVLIYAITQPAITVVKGNNLVRQQLVISCITGVLAIIGILVLVPRFGILGAGIALLIAEITANIAFLHVAKNWLHQNKLHWPIKPYSIAVASVCIAALSMAALNMFPEAKWIIMIVSSMLFIWNCGKYWQVLPIIAVDRIKGMLGGLGKILIKL